MIGRMSDIFTGIGNWVLGFVLLWAISIAVGIPLILVVDWFQRAIKANRAAPSSETSPPNLVADEGQESAT